MQPFKLTTAQDKAMDCLISDATHCALGGGSRSGKTFLLVRAVMLRALKAAGSRHALFRFRFNSIKSSIIYDTLPKVIKLCWPGLWERCTLNKTDWFLKLPNDSEIWFGGLDDKERTEKILGQEYATIYFNECSQIPFQSVVLALSRLAQKTQNLRLKAYYDFNPPSKRHWTYQRFIDKKNPENNQPERDPDDYDFFLINPADNKENLDSGYLKLLESLPEKARNRFLLGKFADDSDGALWTDDIFSRNRRLGRKEENLPDFLRIVVAVDPSGCSGEEDTRSDEIGIVVAALGADGHGYLLEDLSGRYKPEQWGQIAVTAYKRHRADRIVAESNYGGAMVEMCVRTADSNVAFSMVTASRGKVVRAEPIAALYEQNKVHHIGYFPEIEEQLCAFSVSGYQGLRSPDRADACLVAGTLVTTDAGEIPIEDVTTDRKVLTRLGWKNIEWAGKTREKAVVYRVTFSDGSEIVGTGEHPIYCIGLGFVPISCIISGSEILRKEDICALQKSSLMETSIAGIQAAKIRVNKDITALLQGEGSKLCTEQSGNTIMGLFQKAFTSIMSTAISLATISPTLNAFPAPNTTLSMTINGTLSSVLSPERGRRSGTRLEKAWLGTRNTQNRRGATESGLQSGTAPLAELKLAPSRRTILAKMACDTALESVTERWQTRLIDTLSSPLALFAEKITSKTSIATSRKHVHVVAVRRLDGKEQPVFNIHTHDCHEFFANGVLVHNCVWAFSELFPGIIQKPKERKELKFKSKGII